MSLMSWNESMSVGIASIDVEHQKLVATLNDLFDGVQAGRGTETLGRILERLIDYTKTHFGNEERLFAQYGYSGGTDHKIEHESLTMKVLEIQRKYHAGATDVLIIEAMTFLRNWLVKHIQGSDMKFAPFLKSKGAH